MTMVFLFDLDGTIINSQEGVTKCVQYALHHFGIEEPDLTKLLPFIGPPLQQQFMGLYGMSREQAVRAELKYRERFSEKGMYECKLYPYVEEALKELKENGCTLALASSKNESACVDILKNLGIDHYFDLIGGATDDGRISQKADVLKMVMERMGSLNPADYVLVGDTKYDAVGAKTLHMDCIGVSYGFGTKEELEAAGAVCICDSAREVAKYIEEHYEAAETRGIKVASGYKEGEII